MIPSDDDTRRLLTVDEPAVASLISRLLTVTWPRTRQQTIAEADGDGWELQPCPDGELIFSTARWPLPGPYVRVALAGDQVRYVTFPITAGIDLPTPTLVQHIYLRHLATAVGVAGEPDRYEEGANGIARWDTVSGSVTVHADGNGVTVVAASHDQQPAWDVAHGFAPQPAWDQFSAGLAAEFGRGCLDDVIILEHGAHQFVQWIQNTDSILIHASDNDSAPLRQAQRALLQGGGWLPPGDDYGPMWTRVLAWRADPDLFASAARTITWTVRDVLGVAGPKAVTAQAFNVISGETFTAALTRVEYARAVADAQVRQADLRLHQANAAYLLKHDVPGAKIVAAIPLPADRRPTREHSGEFFLDHIVYVPGDDAHIGIWSHVTAQGQAGSRLVPQHPSRQGPYVRAEQGTALYVRDLLQRNPILARALHDDPELHATLTALLASGSPGVVRAQRVQSPGVGETAITTTRYRLDDSQLDLPSLRLAQAVVADSAGRGI